jgi:hypothetical protein
MLRGTALASVAILPLLGACVVPDDGLDRSYATPSVAFQGRAPMDHDRGIWGAQSITPPAGLVLVRQGSLVGRNIEDNGGNPLAWIEYLLIDPSTTIRRPTMRATRWFQATASRTMSPCRFRQCGSPRPR